jgi:hypothetical protein
LDRTILLPSSSYIFRHKYVLNMYFKRIQLVCLSFADNECVYSLSMSIGPWPADCPKYKFFESFFFSRCKILNKNIDRYDLPRCLSKPYQFQYSTIYSTGTCFASNLIILVFHAHVSKCTSRVYFLIKLFI